MTTSVQALDLVLDLLRSVDSLQDVREGIPELPETATAAWVTVGPRAISDQFAGIVQRVITFYVWTGYRVEGREEEAERKLLQVVDDIETAYYLARSSNPLFSDVILDTSLAGAPEYREYNEEYRLYPITLTVVLRNPRPS